MKVFMYQINVNKLREKNIIIIIITGNEIKGLVFSKNKSLDIIIILK